MTIKHSTTHGSTRKNKRIMSGGKGKISNYTQRFKKHYNRFIEINDTSDNSKLKKMEIWGQMKGIYKFLQLQKATYKVVDEADVVSQVSGLEKMKENINNSTDLSNKEGYDKAMECLDKGDDTILSDGVCVSYNEFVNGDARDAEEDESAEAEASVPAPVPAEEDESAETEASAPASVPAEEDESAETEASVPASVPAEEDAAEAEPSVTAPAPAEEDAAEAEPSVPAPAPAEEDESGETEPSVPAPAPVPAEEDENEEVKSEQGGGRSRRHTRPSRHIKPQKSRKVRRTRRKHRSVRR
jgi:hypothetical protein